MPRNYLPQTKTEESTLLEDLMFDRIQAKCRITQGIGTLELAQKLHISYSKCHAHLQTMEREGRIKCVVKIEHSKLYGPVNNTETGTTAHSREPQPFKPLQNYDLYAHRNLAMLLRK